MLVEAENTGSAEGELWTEPLPSCWYLVHTKPRQEYRALENLERQGYECFLPLYLSEKVIKGRLRVIEEPLFPRYLFIHLATGMDAKSWGPIRSTVGVNGLVRFGDRAAKVESRVVNLIRSYESQMKLDPERLFTKGDMLQVVDGPFAGMEVVFQMSDGENRAIVLIELLGKMSRLQLSPSELKKIE